HQPTPGGSPRNLAAMGPRKRKLSMRALWIVANTATSALHRERAWAGVRAAPREEQKGKIPREARAGPPAPGVEIRRARRHRLLGVAYDLVCRTQNLDNSGNKNQDRSIQPSALGPVLAVTTSSFRPSYFGRAVTIRWRTASEVNVLGFNVYRVSHGQRV